MRQESCTGNRNKGEITDHLDKQVVLKNYSRVLLRKIVGKLSTSSDHLQKKKDRNKISRGGEKENTTSTWISKHQAKNNVKTSGNYLEHNLKSCKKKNSK